MRAQVLHPLCSLQVLAHATQPASHLACELILAQTDRLARPDHQAPPGAACPPEPSAPTSPPRPGSSLERVAQGEPRPPTSCFVRRALVAPHLALLSDIPASYGLTDDSVPCALFVGPLTWSPDIALPAWWSQLDARRPTIYVTLGSSGGPSLLPRLVEYLTRLDVQLIVSTAGANAPPPNERVFCADYLPGDLAAARSCVVVCNGGSPTAYQALQKGVPVLGVPGNLDQFLNMHYLENAGVALSHRNAELTPRHVARTIGRLLHEPQFAASAQRLARACASLSCPSVVQTILAQATQRAE